MNGKRLLIHLLVVLSMVLGTLSLATAAPNPVLDERPLGPPSQFDWGDAPDPTYPTLAINGGAAHQITSGFLLGAVIDAEPNGQPNANATGDDIANLADEDGVTFNTPLVAGAMAGVTVLVTAPPGPGPLLQAWIDFNADGDWADAGEQIFTNQAVIPGPNLLNFIVPPGSMPGPTFARFRLSTMNNLGFAGPAPNGEVEDYLVEIQGEADFGDAPDPTYPTKLVNNGARHALSPAFLGATIDPESDGQPDANALGDDNNNIDDEDGVDFLTPLVVSTTAAISVTASCQGKLNAWLDFNRDGDWADAGEQIFKNTALITGVNFLFFPVTSTATITTTFARFRFSTAGGLSYTGPASDGEVEDYEVEIEGTDWGDAPVSYSTLLVNNGARHSIVPGYFLGAAIDSEPDGQPSANALGDDNNGVPDDEDGVAFNGSVMMSTTVPISVTASGAGKLNAWLDFNRDGDWSEANEQIFVDTALVAGVNSLFFTVPVTATAGSSFARFRFNSTGGLSYTGAASDGEVEDYQVWIEGLDFGDAPDPTYPTLTASNGARHNIVAGVFLGAAIDGEPEGQPSATALGDDNSGIDDEDGVTFNGPLAVGAAVPISVTTSVPGFLNAWVDFNADGDWAEANEQIFANLGLPPGTNGLGFTVPPTAVVTTTTYARFRFNTAGGLSYTGLASDGEVEDYKVKIEGTDFGDAPVSYSTLLANNGARHNIVPGYFLGAAIDAEPDGQPSADASGDDNNGVPDDEDGVAFNGSVMMSTTVPISVTASGAGKLTAWLDFNRDGDWSEANEQIFVNKALVAGANSLFFTVPVTATAGSSFARFRFNSTGGLSYTGAASDGEVEDDQVWIEGLDFGDAPDPTYPTLAASNGARHNIVSTVFLGATIDGEPDGQKDANALGDDNAGVDDEDGVIFNGPLMVNQTVPLSVTASVAGLLQGWVDFNRDGDWADVGEQIFNNRALVPGVNALTFAVPPAAVTGTTFARFRFSTAGGLGYTGLAGDGEVEDYKLNIVPIPSIGVELDKSLTSPAGGTAVLSDTITFRVTVTDTGQSSFTSNPFTDTFTNCLTFLSAKQGGVTVSGVGPDSPLTWDLVTVNGQSITVGQVITIDLSFRVVLTGTCVNRAEVIEYDAYSQSASDDDEASVNAISKRKLYLPIIRKQ